MFFSKTSVYAIAILAATTASAQQPIPVGLDAYRQLDQWPTQRIGQRTYMRSTYDRTGGNQGIDASHFLYQVSDTTNVTLDLQGPGILMFTRFNRWHGSPWQYIIDGQTHLIADTATANPTHPGNAATFIPSEPFPAPLNLTWPTTQFADLIYTPIGFEHTFQMAYTRTKYGTGYYIYDQFVPGTPLSHPITNWSESDIPTQDVLDLLNKAGTDLSPPSGTVLKDQLSIVAANKATTIATLTGKKTIRALKFSITKDQAKAFEHTRLRITWDNRKEPSVDVPIALFYGAGSLYNRENREYLVKALPVSIQFQPSGLDDRISFSCYFPMPFFKSARIELVTGAEPLTDLRYAVTTLSLTDTPDHQAYFHATYRDIPKPTPGQDMVFLDTTNIEGARDWSGSFIGTSFIFSHTGQLHTLEGDPRFFFDDSLTPQAQGTGTEEWGGGGDYWHGGKQTTLPFVGHPLGKPKEATANNDDDNIESAYRFLLGDLFPFGKNAIIHFEHGGSDEDSEHYESIAYWYGLPSPSLVLTDQLQIGDLKAEKSHAYSSPNASAPYDITSRYELGVDHLKGKPELAEVFPATTDRGRTTKTFSEFTLKIRPDNRGILLRRKLDYQYPDQRAEVSIQDASGKWQLAGTWYLAGSNTIVYSNPKDELGATEHNAITSNRRFRDDEFLLPLALTQGRNKLRIRVQFTPLNRPLYPGAPLADQAWSEIKYTAYAFITPNFKL